MPKNFSNDQMTLKFTTHAWQGYQRWQKKSPHTLAKINSLIISIHQHPFMGPGKPQALTGSLTGYWSRRITQQHRLVYKIDTQTASKHQSIFIIQTMFNQ